MEKKKIIINVVIYIILFIILDIFFGIVYSGDTRQRENYLYIIPSILVYSLIYIFILIISKNTKKTNTVFYLCSTYNTRCYFNTYKLCWC